MILPDSAELELKIPLDARSTMWVCFDGARGAGASSLRQPPGGRRGPAGAGPLRSLARLPRSRRLRLCVLRALPQGRSGESFSGGTASGSG